MLALDKTYTRISPNGQELEVTIKTQKELDYHRDLIHHGYEYKQKLVIHTSNEACLSCQG